MTKKKPTRAASAPLSPEWIDAPGDAALSAIDAAGDAASALVQAWVDTSNAAALAAIAERVQSPLRKAAKRGLQVLRARGLAVPKPLPAQPALAAAPAADLEPEAWLCAPGHQGHSLLAFTLREGSGRVRICLVTLAPDASVERIDTGVVSRSDLKRIFDDLRPSFGSERIKVPLEWARHRVAQGRAIHAARGTVEPLGFASAASLLQPIPDLPPPHPFDEEGFEVADEDASSIAAASAALHQLPEFVTWLPERTAVVQLLVETGQVLTTTDVEKLSSDEAKAAFERAINAGTDAYFGAAERQRVAARMKDSALSVLARHGEEQALLTAATIRAIERLGEDAPAHQVPFLRSFFEKALAMLANAPQGPEVLDEFYAL